LPIDHLIIPDTQVKPGVPIEHLAWIGEYIVDKRPSKVIHLGDHFDMPSLSTYDKGTAKIEGQRIHDDILAGQAGMQALVAPMVREQFFPEMWYIPGNHDERLLRYVNTHPEAIGSFGWHSYGLEQYGWNVANYLEPVDIDGILYSHYFANPMSGKAYTGTSLHMLKTLGRSFVMGHRQVLDFATRTLVDGSQQIGIVAGACYLHDEGNKHWRGIVVLHDVQDGFGNPMFVDLPFLERKYAKEVGQVEARKPEHKRVIERGARSTKELTDTSKRVSKAIQQNGDKRNSERARSSSRKGVPTRTKGR
jgi:hypothetical protein